MFGDVAHCCAAIVRWHDGWLPSYWHPEWRPAAITCCAKGMGYEAPAWVQQLLAVATMLR